MRVAFFVGNDVTSHLIVNQAFPRILEAGHTPYLCYTRQRPAPRAEPELRELFHYERGLLDGCVYPYLDSLPAPLHGTFLSPAGIARLHRGAVVVRSVEDVNSPEFVASLAADGVGVGFSVRCYQKFRLPLIAHFSPEAGAEPLFANLHPGILPQYRGVLTFARSMLHGEAEAGFTLHRVDEDWDAGEILATCTRPLDYGLSVLENMWAQVDPAVDLLLAAVDEAAALGRWTGRPQQAELAGYYSHLDRSDLERMSRAGIDLMRPQSVLAKLVGSFTPADSPEGLRLGGILTGLTSRRPGMAPALG
ncbi:formyltransferase family protein [Streptomyces sp. NPDC001380]|uniref:formyltransferase family protein n=1 Tax=Streptomyces sp. NPDC001380 TaxID=3364566 RepID=UPI00368C4866